MMMRWIGQAALLALVMALPAEAAMISRTYDISAFGFGSWPGLTDTLTGSFTLTFDNATDITDSTAGLIVNNFNHPAAGSIGVHYNYWREYDMILFGGAINGANQLNSGTNDFMLAITSASAETPTFNFALQSIEGEKNAVFGPAYGTVTARSTPVSEPAALALLGTGLLGLAVLRGRQRLG